MVEVTRGVPDPRYSLSRSFARKRELWGVTTAGSPPTEEGHGELSHGRGSCLVNEGP